MLVIYSHPGDEKSSMTDGLFHKDIQSVFYMASLLLVTM